MCSIHGEKVTFQGFTFIEYTCAYIVQKDYLNELILIAQSEEFTQLNYQVKYEVEHRLDLTVFVL